MKCFIKSSLSGIKKNYEGSLLVNARSYIAFFISEARTSTREDGSIKYKKTPCIICKKSDGTYYIKANPAWKKNRDNVARFYGEVLKDIDSIQAGSLVEVHEYKDTSNVVTTEKILHLGLCYISNSDETWLDFDHVLTEDGKCKTRLMRSILRQFGSFAERSVSGDGCHIMLKTKLPEGMFNATQWEGQVITCHDESVSVDVFNQEHLIYVTGEAVECTSEDKLLKIDDAAEKIKKFFNWAEELTSKEDHYISHSEQKKAVKANPSKLEDLEDTDIIDILEKGCDKKPIPTLSRMLRCDPDKKDLQFISELNGMGAGAHKFNFSDAVYRTCYRLHFYCKDVDQAVRIFKQSGMYKYMMANGGSSYLTDSILTAEAERGFKAAADHGNPVYSAEAPIKKKKDDAIDPLPVFDMAAVLDWYRNQKDVKIFKDADTSEWDVRGSIDGITVRSLESLIICLYSKFKVSHMFTKKADVADFLKTILDNDRTTTKVYPSFAYVGDKIYHSIGDDEHFVEISKDGWKEISADQIADLGIYFKQRDKYYPIAVHNSNALDGYNTLSGLTAFSHLTDKERLLVIGWIIQTFTDSSHMILNIQADAGSGKTSLTKVIQQITDPSEVLSALPDNPREMAVICADKRVVSFDNQRYINSTISDVICCLATTGSYTTRKLHSDKTRVSIKLNSSVILNGIQLGINARDLAERSISISLRTLNDSVKVDVEDIENEAVAAGPVIMGWIYDILSNYLKIGKSIPTSKHRMVKAIQLVQSAEKGGLMPFEEGSFEAAVSESFIEARSDMISANPLCEFIYRVAVGETSDTTKFSTDHWFDRSTSELLKNDKLFDNRPSEGYVKLPSEVFYNVLKAHVSEYKNKENRVIGTAIARVKSDLKTIYNITIERDRSVRGHDCYVITRPVEAADNSNYPIDWDDPYDTDDVPLKFDI